MSNLEKINNESLSGKDVEDLIKQAIDEDCSIQDLYESVKFTNFLADNIEVFFDDFKKNNL